MSKNNKSYRIRTTPGKESNVLININQTYSAFDVLSLKIDSEGLYKIHNSNYGVIVGRVIANGGFGVPNAKISLFIESDGTDAEPMANLYSYASVNSKNDDNVRYNLLPDKNVTDCHKAVGTFPNKQYMLDNSSVLEVYDKYYKFTTRTNESGDYMIMGVPVGDYTLHMDLDISDCGSLSQRPRDFIYKGYTIEQFENANQFKDNDELSALPQIFSQDKSVTVVPFWGASNDGESIGITRADIEISFKFETTCVFLGSAIADNNSNGVGKKCVPTDSMGSMEDVVTGEGRIEMIRKTADGNVEEFQIKGNELINENGVWCYQIPMNLDYMITDEFGKMVPTDDSSKGIATRARVRFRCSMHESEDATGNYYLAKALIPHNPRTKSEIDYDFGTSTKDSSYRDLFWNNVYSVKSFIPRVQKSKRWKNDRFTGIKNCNFSGSNNPMPYNNMRVKMPFMFTIICAIIKAMIRIVSWVNRLMVFFYSMKFWRKTRFRNGLIVLSEGLCPDLDGWFFAPVAGNRKRRAVNRMLSSTVNKLKSENDNDEDVDSTSIDSKENSNICVTTNVSYLISCVEMNLAQEYRVIKFDFYNDWVNGVIYFPRWMRQVRKKVSFAGFTLRHSKVIGCTSNNSNIVGARYYTQQCALPYKVLSTGLSAKNTNESHYNRDLKRKKVIGRRDGLVNTFINQKEQYIYYFKPAVFDDDKCIKLFANDLVLFGSLNDCDQNGVPQFYKYLIGTTYVMPTNLALTNMDSNAYIYGNESGRTKCSGRYPSSSTEEFIQENANNFKGERDYGDIDEYNELDDIIPITESAGISWNYTGPDQGTATDDGTYSPGGHFLGLSCRSSIVNQKSCVNLSRICELGANMSQRKEIPNGVVNGEMTYLNIVPNGVVSGEELTDLGFRSMFATLNHRRLVADALDRESGYPNYTFSYIRPLNFDGSLAPYLKSCDGLYNNTDGDLYVKERLQEARSMGIGVSLSSIDSGHTINRLNEVMDDAYVKFRFGVDNYSQLKNKFLNVSGGYYYLPQYENSFYFYFGLRSGSTAIDEFNKQFFADCNRGLIDTSVPSVIVEIQHGDNSDCLGYVNLKLSFKNMTAPYSVAFEGVNNTIKKSGIEGDSVEFNNVMYDDYKLTVTDSLDRQYTKDFLLKDDNFVFDKSKIEVVDFDRRVADKTEEERINETYKALINNEQTSGYITIFPGAVSYGGSSIIDFINGDYSLIITSGGKYISTNSTFRRFSGVAFTGNTCTVNSGIINVCLWDASGEYSIFVGRHCSVGGLLNNEVFSYLTSFSTYGVDRYTLYVGNRNVSLEKYLNRLKPEWWNLLDDKPFVNQTAEDEDAITTLKLSVFKQGEKEEGEDLCVRYADINGNQGSLLIIGQGERSYGQVDTKNPNADDITGIGVNYIKSGYDLDIYNAITPSLNKQGSDITRRPFTVIPMDDNNIPMMTGYSVRGPGADFKDNQTGLAMVKLPIGKGWSVTSGDTISYVTYGDVASGNNMLDINTIYGYSRVVAIFDKGYIAYPYYDSDKISLCFDISNENVPEYVPETIIDNESFVFYIGLTVPLIYKKFTIMISGREKSVLVASRSKYANEKSIDFNMTYRPEFVTYRQNGGVTYNTGYNRQVGDIIINGVQTTGGNYDIQGDLINRIVSINLTDKVEKLTDLTVEASNVEKEGFEVDKDLYTPICEIESPFFDIIEPYWSSGDDAILNLSGGENYSYSDGKYVDSKGNSISYSLYKSTVSLQMSDYYYDLSNSNDLQYYTEDGWKPFDKVILWISDGDISYIGIDKDRNVYYDSGTNSDVQLRENYTLQDIINALGLEVGMPYIDDSKIKWASESEDITPELLGKRPYIPSSDSNSIVYKVVGEYNGIDHSFITREYPVLVVKTGTGLQWVFSETNFEEMARQWKSTFADEVGGSIDNMYAERGVRSDSIKGTEYGRR